MAVRFSNWFHHNNYLLSNYFKRGEKFNFKSLQSIAIHIATCWHSYKFMYWRVFMNACLSDRTHKEWHQIISSGEEIGWPFLWCWNIISETKLSHAITITIWISLYNSESFSRGLTCREFLTSICIWGSKKMTQSLYVSFWFMI